jgi:hypothetical protein
MGALPPVLPMTGAAVMQARHEYDLEIGEKFLAHIAS